MRNTPKGSHAAAAPPRASRRATTRASVFRDAPRIGRGSHLWTRGQEEQLYHGRQVIDPKDPSFVSGKSTSDIRERVLVGMKDRGSAPRGRKGHADTNFDSLAAQILPKQHDALKRLTHRKEPRKMSRRTKKQW